MTYFHDMKVPVAGAVISNDDLSLAADALKEKAICHGKYNREFEKKFAEYIGSRFAVSCNSGSSANLLAMSALGLNPGDEVITTALNFVTTVNPIIQCGATPVFVDCELDGNTTWDLVREAITPKTKAAIFAHALGRPFDPFIIYCLRQMNIPVIEDCCDALGGVNGYSETVGKVGSHGVMSTFSFYPAHQITTGEGGVVVTSSNEYWKRLLSFRDWGRDCWCEPGHDNTCGRRFADGNDHKYTYSNIGYNLKMTNIQAAIGIKQLEHIEHFVSVREANYKYLDNYMHMWFMEDKKKFPLYVLKVRKERTSYFGYPVILRNGADRRELMEHLEKKGVGVRTWFSGNITKQPAYKGVNYRKVGSLAMTDYLANNAFWIGVHPGLTFDHLDYACDRMREWFAKH